MFGLKPILFSTVLAGTLAIAGLGRSASAQGVYTPGYGYAPTPVAAPVYVPPTYVYPSRPVYVAPPPVYYQPAPVVVYGGPAYCPPVRVYEPFHFSFREGRRGHGGFSFGIGGW